MTIEEYPIKMDVYIYCGYCGNYNVKSNTCKVLVCKQIPLKTGESKTKYEVKNVKTFIGTEGQGFNASLYRNEKKVAFVIDSADGGCYNFQWEDWKEPNVDINITNYTGKPHSFKGTPEEKIFDEFIELLPKETSDHFPDGLKIDNDMFVSKLVDTFLSERKIKRLCSKNYLFQIGKNIGSGEYHSFKKQPNLTRERVEIYIKKTYPNQKYKLLEE